MKAKEAIPQALRSSVNYLGCGLGSICRPLSSLIQLEPCKLTELRLIETIREQIHELGPAS